jgi:hypothetical protein
MTRATVMPAGLVAAVLCAAATPAGARALVN